MSFYGKHSPMAVDCIMKVDSLHLKISDLPGIYTLLKFLCSCEQAYFQYMYIAHWYSTCSKQGKLLVYFVIAITLFCTLFCILLRVPKHNLLQKLNFFYEKPDECFI